MTVYWNEKALLWIIIVALLDLRFCQGKGKKKKRSQSQCI